MVAQVVAHRTMEWEDSGSIPAPAGSWAFFSISNLSSLNQWCALNQVSRGGATLLVFNFPRKRIKKSLVVQLEAKQATCPLNKQKNLMVHWVINWDWFPVRIPAGHTSGQFGRVRIGSDEKFSSADQRFKSSGWIRWGEIGNYLLTFGATLNWPLS